MQFGKFHISKFMNIVGVYYKSIYAYYSLCKAEVI